MLSLQSQALINSFAWPLLDYQALASGWSNKEWAKLHDAFLLNRFPSLGRDEIVQIRCLAWPPASPLPPTPREAAGRLAHLFTEVRGGKVVLKSHLLSPKPFLHYPAKPDEKRDWTPPEDIAKGWLYAARLVQPTILAAYWDQEECKHPRREKEIETDFNQLESLCRSGLGDYHIHQAAAIDQKYFFPLLPLHPGCWEGLAKPGKTIEQQWTPLDQGLFASSQDINFILLVLAHGGLAWLLLHHTPFNDAKHYWKQIHDLLCEKNPGSSLEAQEEKKRAIFWQMSQLAAQTSLSPPGPDNRDCWMDRIRLCTAWRNLKEEESHSPHALPPQRKEIQTFLFDRMLWLRNLIFRLFAQPPGRSGFANFKVWFSRAEYGEQILDYMRPIPFPIRLRNPLEENLESVTPGGRVERIEFRASFKDNEKICRIVRQYNQIKAPLLAEKAGQMPKTSPHAKVLLTFSQQLIKDEDKNQPDGICSLEGGESTKKGGTPGPRYRDLLRKYVADVSNTVQYARRHPEILLLIRGLDIVNHERRTPNWVPGLAYRFYNDTIEAAYLDSTARDGWNPPPYRHTFHAGEDFWLPSDGLRAIFEPIHFNILRRDDRIGHGLVLGLDLEAWARGANSLVTRLGSYWDDLVWEWHLIRQGAIDGTTSPIQEEMDQLLDEMEKSLAKSSSLKFFEKMFPNDRWKAYALRFDYDWLKRKGVVGELASGSWFCDDHFKRENFLEPHQLLYLEYMTSQTLWRIWEQSCLIRVDAKRVERWKRLQDYVIDLVAKSGIIVEACPTSNVLISGVNTYAEHPIFRMAPPDGTGRLLVSLNTDDPITFSPNIRLEYQQLYQTAMEKGLSVVETLKWLEHIKHMGLNASFLPSEWEFSDRDKRLARLCTEL